MLEFGTPRLFPSWVGKIRTHRRSFPESDADSDTLHGKWFSSENNNLTPPQYSALTVTVPQQQSTDNTL